MMWLMRRLVTDRRNRSDERVYEERLVVESEARKIVIEAVREGVAITKDALKLLYTEAEFYVLVDSRTRVERYVYDGIAVEVVD